MHIAIARWRTAVAERDHDLMNRFLMRVEIVPEHVGVLEVRSWVSLLCVDEKRKQRWISDEEDRCIVEDPVEITLLGVKLGRHPTGITGCVG